MLIENVIVNFKQLHNNVEGLLELIASFTVNIPKPIHRPCRVLKKSFKFPMRVEQSSDLLQNSSSPHTTPL